MKLILYVEDTDAAVEAVVASRSMEKDDGDLVGVKMSSGKVFSVTRRRTGLNETLTVRQQTS